MALTIDTEVAYVKKELKEIIDNKKHDVCTRLRAISEYKEMFTRVDHTFKL